ncbi:hypothetical protein AB0C38_02295 [Amycolatopsis sp. NPDC048633]|uniref:hypothetical protein n=1 Tax=Amycolatopsis sp. NPDC048633 TaxID=3157095 RepID=UPI0033CE50BD
MGVLPTLWRQSTLWLSTAGRLLSLVRLAALRRLRTVRWLATLQRLGAVLRSPALRWLAALRWPPTRRLTTRWHPARVLRRHPSGLLVRRLTAACGHWGLRCRAAGASWTATAVRHSSWWGWREAALGRGLLRRPSALERRRPPIGRERLVRAAR